MALNSNFKDSAGAPKTQPASSGSAKAPGSPGAGAATAGAVTPKQVENLPTKGSGLRGGSK